MSYNHPASFVFGGESINLRSQIKLTLALLKTKQYLTNFVRDPQFSDHIKTAFGIDLDAETALDLSQKWLNRNFRRIPKIQILTSEQLQGANGAFSATTNTIYISQNFIQENNFTAIAGLLLEEIGHKIDSIFNETDSPGDEGEIFSALVRGENLSPEELEQLYQENDWGTLNLNGQIISVEKQDFTGTNGDDTINGTSNNDQIWGLDGNDNLNGKQGNDSILGGFGDDYLYGEGGNDTLEGGSGDDNLYPGTGIDSISGGDQIYADYLYLDLSSETLNLIVDCTYPNNGTVSNGTVFNGIEQLQVITGSGNDSINVSGSTFAGFPIPTFTNFINAGAGNDSITGSIARDELAGEDGNDTIAGGDGDDFFYPGTGVDSVIGGTGNDRLIVDFSTATTPITVTYINTNKGTISNGTKFKEIESINLQTGSGNDNINVSAVSFSGYYDFDFYTTRIFAGAGNDKITTGSSDDLLYGEAGNDILNGGIGYDTMVGGIGNDSYTIDTFWDVIIENISEGTDTVTVSSDYALGDHLENLTLIGTANINGTGNDLNNTIKGNNGNNTLTGSIGNDTLVGNAGNDMLTGGMGNDTLTGSVGLDQFTFNTPAEGIDRITDFNVTDDTISVSASGFGGGLIVNSSISPSQFYIGATATTAAQRFIYNNSTGALFFDLDGNGTTTATQFATLKQNLAMTNTDIFVLA